MSQLKILIVEDELIVAEDIKSHLLRMGYMVAGIASSVKEALDLIENKEPDLIIVDIILKGNQTGIDLGKILQETEKTIPFIYLTSHSDRTTVEKAKSTHPDAYLLKPFRAENLFASIEIAIGNSASKDSNNLKDSESENLFVKDSLFVKKDSLFFKIKIRDIMYVRGEGNYLEIMVVNGSKFVIRSTIKSFGLIVQDFHFFQSHKSYLVNVDYIDVVGYTFIKIRDAEIPMSKIKKEELLALMKSFT